jgi:hypothetical protein
MADLRHVVHQGRHQPGRADLLQTAQRCRDDAAGELHLEDRRRPRAQAGQDDRRGEAAYPDEQHEPREFPGEVGCWGRQGVRGLVDDDDEAGAGEAAHDADHGRDEEDGDRREAP